MKDRYSLLTSRLGSVWEQMGQEVAVSGQPVEGLTHLAVALLTDLQVRSVIPDVEIPAPDELRLALTGVEPLERRLAEQGEKLGANVVALPVTYSELDPSVLDCVERALEGTTVEGLAAQVRVLQEVINDEEVRERLEKVMDIDLLERKLADAANRL